MRLISYALNFEDVMLWRALKNAGVGSYVDVGTHHPVTDSVSRFFYDQGWRGVHIAANAESAALLRQDRPDETVLEIGLAAGALHLALQSLAGREIHWLRIHAADLAQEDFPRGWDSREARPWIIVTQTELCSAPGIGSAAWESILEQANYRFVHFDGLNRFYVAAEHARLCDFFATPPNLSDGFALSGKASSAWCDVLRESLRQKTEQADMLTIELAKARQEVAALSVGAVATCETVKLQGMPKPTEQKMDPSSTVPYSRHNSRTWRIALPLRQLMLTGRAIAKGTVLMVSSPKQTSRRMIRAGLVWTMRKVSARNQLQHQALQLLSRYPGLKHRFRLLAIRAGLIMDSRSPIGMDNPLTITSANGEICLPPRAEAIFKALKQAIKENETHAHRH